MGVPPLINNTKKTSGDEDLVKIHPAIAEHQKEKTKNTEHILKHETSPSLAA